MALIACPSCENQISDKAAKCPKCGATDLTPKPEVTPVSSSAVGPVSAVQAPVMPTRYTQYKVIHIAEGGCGTILLGAAGLPLQKIENQLNAEAANGWNVVFQVIESKRYLLFWQREALIVTLGK